MQIENSRKLSHNNLVPKRTWTWMEYDLACMFHIQIHAEIKRQHNKRLISQASGIFFLDIDIARVRLLADKRQLQAIITNPDASVKDKLEAINSDIALNITLMRLEYEGNLFIENYKRNVPLRKTDRIDQGS